MIPFASEKINQGGGGSMKREKDRPPPITKQKPILKVGEGETITPYNTPPHYETPITQNHEEVARSITISSSRLSSK
jgi:hypothetical protein